MSVFPSQAFALYGSSQLNIATGVITTDQSLKDCLIIMVGDVDHLIRMKIADTMTTLYGAGETLMSCDQQEAIYQQVNNALLDLISLNVSIIISFLFVINYALYLCLKILLIQKVYNIRR